MIEMRAMGDPLARRQLIFSGAFGRPATMDAAMDSEILEQIAAVAALIVAVTVFAAMAYAGTLADGAGLPTLRRHRS